ncbi:MAG TPA: urease accessory UreF family protein [Stellaceae bacterium]|nr:urease accessory UreF family protein [Stellaceae bacterium]
MDSHTIITTAIMVTTEAALYRLMTWLSPAYPLGAFSYSHGLEYAVETDLVRDRDTLCAWAAAAVSHGAGRSDGALLTASWHAVAKSDETALDDIVELAVAWRGTAETALESKAQGAAFLAATRAAWPHLVLDRLSLRHRGDVVLPVAVGAAAAAHDVPLAPVLTAYLHAFSSNLVSAGMRLIPLGQSDGQRAIAALEVDVARAVEASMATPLADIGTAAPMLDWCSMRHETQYTRLFRS